MKVGFDIDGVIAKNPWKEKDIWNTFLSYFVRPPYEEVRQVIVDYHNRGYIIFIVSGIWNYFKPVVWLWLKYHKIPFDYLILNRIGKIAKFKCQVVKKYELDMFLEDSINIVEEMKRCLSKKGKNIFGNKEWRFEWGKIYILLF